MRYLNSLRHKRLIDFCHYEYNEVGERKLEREREREREGEGERERE